MIIAIRVLFLCSFLICFAHIGGGIAQTAEAKNSTISEYGDKKAKIHAVARENYGAKVQFAAFSPNTDTLSENTNNLRQIETKNSETAPILLAQVGSNEITINGVFEHAQTLTVDISQLSDTNPNNYTYQWWRSIDNGATFAEISGASRREYVVNSFGDFRITSTSNLAQVLVSVVHSPTSVGSRSQVTIYQPAVPQVELEYFYDNLYMEHVPSQPASTIRVNIVSSNIATENSAYLFVVVNDGELHTSTKRDPTNPVFALDLATFSSSELRRVIDEIPVNERGEIGRLNFRVDVDGLVDYLSGEKDIRVFGHEEPLQRGGIGRIEVVGGGNIVGIGSVLQPYIEDPNGIDRNQILNYSFNFLRDFEGASGVRVRSYNTPAPIFNQPLPRYTLVVEDIRHIALSGGGVSITPLSPYRDGLGTDSNFNGSGLELRVINFLDIDIDGVFEHAQTLTTDISRLADTNPNNYDYQWWRSIDNGSTFQEIDGATRQEYVIDSFRDFRIASPGSLARVFVSVIHAPTLVGSPSPTLIYETSVIERAELEYVYDNLYVEYDDPDQPASDISVRIINSNIATENLEYEFYFVISQNPSEGSQRLQLTRATPTNPVFTLSRAVFGDSIETSLDTLGSFAIREGDGENLGFLVAVTGRDYLSGRRVRIEGHREDFQQPPSPQVSVVGGGNFITEGSVLQPDFREPNGVNINTFLNYELCFGGTERERCERIFFRSREYSQSLPTYTVSSDDILFLNQGDGRLYFRTVDTVFWFDSLNNTNLPEVSNTDIALMSFGIDGVFEEGETLTADVELFDSLSPAATYQWWRSIDNGTTFQEIPGATAQEYVVNSLRDFNITVTNNIAQVYVVAEYSRSFQTITNTYNSSTLIYQPISTANISLEYDNLYAEFRPGQPASTISIRLIDSNVDPSRLTYNLIGLVNNAPGDSDERYVLGSASFTDPVFILNRASGNLEELFNRLSENNRINGSSEHLRLLVEANIIDYLSGPVTRVVDNIIPWQQPGTARLEVVGDETIVTVGSVLQPYLNDINGFDRGQTLFYDFTFSGSRPVSDSSIIKRFTITTTEYNQPLPTYTLKVDDVQAIASGHSPHVILGPIRIMWRDNLGNINLNRSVDKTIIPKLTLNIEGTFVEGGILMAAISAMGEPSGYTYQWWRSIDNGATFQEIGGATGQEYVVDSFGDFRITSTSALAQVFVSVVHSPTSMRANSPTLIYRAVSPRISYEYVYDNLYIEYLPDFPASNIRVSILNSNVFTGNLEYVFILNSRTLGSSPFERDNPNNPIITLDRATYGGRIPEVFDGIEASERGEVAGLLFHINITGVVDYLSGRRPTRDIRGNFDFFQQGGRGGVEVVGGGNIIEVGSVLQPYIEDPNGIDRGQTLDYIITFISGANSRRFIRQSVVATIYNQPLSRYTLTMDDIRFLESPGSRIIVDGEYRDGLGGNDFFNNEAQALRVRVLNFDIFGVFNEGETLRANITFSRLSDKNPNNYTYQWWRSIDNGATFTEINGATGQQYVVDLARDFVVTSVTAQVLASVIHTPTSIGYISPPLTLLLDQLGTERLEVVGGETTLTVGSVLRPHLDDINGLGRGQTLNYEIIFIGTRPSGDFLVRKNFAVQTTIYNQLLSSYTLNIEDVEAIISKVDGNANIILPRFRWRDALGNINNESITSPNLNNALGITVRASIDFNIRGIFEEGKTLVAAISQLSITDPNSYTYQWWRSIDNGATFQKISGATEHEYVVNSSQDFNTSLDEFSHIYVAVNRVTNALNLISPALIYEESFIDGVFEHAQTLTTDVSGLPDTNPNNYTYQWWRSIDSGSTFAEISGATGQEYIVDALRDFNITVENNLAQVFVSVFHTPTSIGSNSPTLIYQPGVAQVSLEYVYDNLYAEYIPGQPASTILVRLISSNIVTTNLTYQLIGLVNNAPGVEADEEFFLGSVTSPTLPVFTLDRGGGPLGELFDALSESNRLNGDGENLRLMAQVITTDYLSGRSVKAQGHMIPWQQPGTVRLDINDGLGDILTPGVVFRAAFDDINGIPVGAMLSYDLSIERCTDPCEISVQSTITTSVYSRRQVVTYTLSVADIETLVSLGITNNIRLSFGALDWFDSIGNRNSGNVLERSFYIALPDINGVFEDGKTLTAGVSGLIDIDPNNYIYQWERSIDNGNTFSAISDAINREYTINAAQDFRITVPALAQVRMSIYNTALSLSYFSLPTVYSPVEITVESQYLYDELYVRSNFNFIPNDPTPPPLSPVSTVFVEITSNIATDEFEYLWWGQGFDEASNPIIKDLGDTTRLRLNKTELGMLHEEISGRDRVNGDGSRWGVYADVMAIDLLAGTRVSLRQPILALQQPGRFRILPPNTGDFLSPGSEFVAILDDLNGIADDDYTDVDGNRQVLAMTVRWEISGRDDPIPITSDSWEPNAHDQNPPIQRTDNIINFERAVEAIGSDTVVLLAYISYGLDNDNNPLVGWFDLLDNLNDGSAAMASVTVQIAHAPISGSFIHGQEMIVILNDLQDTNPNNYTYQWLRSINDGSTYEPIPNATSRIYTVDARDFNITTATTTHIRVSLNHNTFEGFILTPPRIYDVVNQFGVNYDYDNLWIAWNGQSLFSTVSLLITSRHTGDDFSAYNTDITWLGRNTDTQVTLGRGGELELRGPALQSLIDQYDRRTFEEDRNVVIVSASIVITDLLRGDRHTLSLPDLNLLQDGTVGISVVGGENSVAPGSKLQVFFDDINGIAGPLNFHRGSSRGTFATSNNDIHLMWNIGGATVSVSYTPTAPNQPYSLPYTLSIDDIMRGRGGEIVVTVTVFTTYNDDNRIDGRWFDLAGQANAEAIVDSSHVATVTLNVRPLPIISSSLVINGNDFTHGGELSANSVSITDDPGVGNAVYVWQSGSGGVYTDTPIATGETLTLNRDDWNIADDSVRLLLEYRYDTSVTLQLATATVHIAQETRGDIGVGGIIAPAVDNAITLTNNLTDDNTTQTIIYQWSRGVGGVFTDIVVDATNSVYVLRANDAQVGEDFQLRASVLHTDSLGYTVSYLTTVSVVLLEINGAIRNGETLTGDTAPFANVPYTYQWQRSLDGGTIYEDIAAANSTTYVVTTTDFVGATTTNPARVRIKLNDDNITLYSEELEHVPPIRVVEATLLYDSLVVGTNVNTGSALTVTIINSNLENTTLSYTWQIIANNSATVTIGTNGSPTWALLDDVAPDNNFEFGDNNNHEIRVVASVFSEFGGVQTIVLASTTVERAGTISILADNVGGLYVGSKVRAELSDKNGVRAQPYTIEWTIGGVIKTVPWTPANVSVSVLTPEYTITHEDIENLMTVSIIAVRVLESAVDGFLDSLGDRNEGLHPQITITPFVPLEISLGVLEGAVSVFYVRQDSGVSELTYQWSEGESDSFDNIDAATSSSYIPLLVYDASFGVSVRAAVGYTYNGIKTTILSAPLRVVGVSLVAAQNNIVGDGLIIGATYTLELDGLRDPLGRVVDSALLNYQWYRTGADGDSLINNAVNNNYILTTNVFNQTNTSLFVRVSDKSALHVGEIESLAVNINDATSGTVGIDGSDYRPGGIFSVNTSDITDDNEGLTYSYQWQRNTTGGSYVNIADATLAAYTVLAADLSDSGVSPTLRLLLEATDAFGFVATLTAEEEFVNNPALGGINIVATGYAHGDNVNLSHTITDANAGTVAIELSSIEWQQRSGDSGSFVAISGETDLSYTIDGADWASTNSGADMLRVVAEYRDPFGETTTLTASVLEMNRPTNGAIVIESLGGGGLEGTTLRVNTSAIRDENGNGSFGSYVWSGGGNTFSGNTDLILNGNSAALLADGGGITLTLLFTDGLGFTRGYTAEYRQFVVDVSLNVNNDRVDSEVNDTNNISNGSYTYQWQESETESGSYEDIGSATNSNYAVPLAHDITKPYVRVEVSYVLTAGGRNVAATVYSAGIQALGISTGDISVTGNNVIVGSTRDANISGIEDLFGRAIPANYVTYQWETSDTLGSNYIAIANAGDTQSYTLASSDFTNNKNYLRLHVESAITGDGYSSDSVGEDINRTVTGVLVIDGSDYRPGGVFSANTSAITDVNGGLTYSYQWQRNTTGGNYADIAGATSASYTVLEADLSGAGTSPTLRLSLLATDDFGFVTTLTAESVFVNSTSTGGINIVAAGYEHEDNVNLSHTITDANAGTVAIELSSIEWQQRTGDSGSFVAISGETGLTYTIDRADWASTNSGANMLRVVAEYRDPFGETTTLTASVLEMDRPPNGAIAIDSLGGGGIEGSTLRVNTSAITDDNGIGTFSGYSWSGDGNTFSGNTDLILDGNSAALLADGGVITLTLLFTDGLGFTRGYTVEYRQLAVDVLLNVNRDSVDSIINDVNNITSGRYTYQWQQNATASGNYENINSATSSSYAVPLDHDITKPYFRVEISYVLTAGGGNVAATVYSSGIKALGISGGNISVTGNNAVVGATRAANIRDIEDLFGRIIPSNYLSYQWQTSDTSDSNYIVIVNGGDTQNYTLASVDFTNNKNYLRLHVESAIPGDGYSSDSSGEDINRAATGALRIDGRDYRPGGVFSANTSAIRDTNGGLTYGYQWQRNTTGGGYTDIAGATTASYTVSEADLSGAGTSPTLRVLVIATDAFGFAATLTAESEFVNSTSTGGINIVATGYEDGDNVNLSHTITDANAGDVAIELSSIEWQQRAGDSGNFVAIAGETGLIYTIDRADWASTSSGADRLQAVAEYRDPFGDVITLTAALIEINRPTNGAIVIESVGGGIIVEGSTLRVNTSSIRDDNGVGAFSNYGWSADGNTLGGNTELVLNSNNVESLADGDGITLTLLFTDGLGFTRGYTAEYRQLAVEVSRNVNSDSVDAVVEDINGITSGRYTYQWQQSETASGSYEDISRATSRSYSVPLGHDITKPYVRVEVSYILTAGSSNVAATVYSAGIQALGISTGNVAISGSGVVIGSTRAANIRGIEDLFGRVVPANYLSYEWQTSDTLDSNYIAIAIAGDTQSYRFAATDFTNNKNYVRLHVESAIAGDVYSSDSVGEDINRAATGALRIDGRDYRPGGVFSANTSAIRDTNGGLTYGYQWQRNTTGGGYTDIAGATTASYTVSEADLSGAGTSPTLRVLVIATDAFGFAATLTAESAFVNSESTGGINIVATGYEDGDNVNLSHTITDANAGDVAIELSSIEWQQRAGDSGNFVAIAGETGLIYTIDRADWASTSSGADRLQAVAEYRDPFGDVITLTAALIEINRPTNGAIVIESVGGGIIVEGSTLRVNTSSIRDDNGVGAFSNYGWSADGNTLGGNTELVLNSNNVESLADGDGITLTLLFTDGLGFTRGYTAEYRQLAVEVSRNVNSDSVDAVVEDINGITSGRYTYQWQQSETASGSYEDISRATSRSYSVPLGHDITKPYVRVEVSYILTAGSSNVAATVYSAGIQALGISTGNVAISGSGVVIGSTRAANIRGIEDLFGRVVPANYLSYEWQTSDTLDSNYIAIAIAGDTQSYRFAATDFTNNKNYVRLHVESAIAGDVYSSDSVGEDINRAATGALRIDGRDYRPGGVFSANTSAIRDTNGGLTYGYQWQRNTTGGGYTDIAGATTASYTVSEADLSGAGTSPTLRVLVIATDAFGFAATLTAESAFVNSESTGGINIVATGYEDGDNVNLSHTITDANAGDVAIELSSIEWQQRAGDSGSFVAIAGETGLIYTIDRADWASTSSGADRLQAVAEYRDPFGDVITLTAALIEINRPTNGAIVIEAVGGGIVVEGSTLRVNTSSIRDDNGVGAFSNYGWSADGNTLVGNTELVLNSNNVESLADGDGITLALLFTDGLGFTRGYTVEYRQLAVEVSRNVNRDSVEAVVEDVNGITSGRYTYQWQQSETASGSYEDISRATSSSYSVPLGHDITKPYVRVEVSYILTAGSSNVAATVYSAGIQALGISTGDVAISGSGVVIGSTRAANIRGIEDLFGRVIPANYLTYRWETSDTLGSNYIAIATAGDTQSYRLAATDFTNNKNYVRLHVESAIAGDGYSSDSVGEDINRAATGALRIDGRDYRPGGVFSANTSAIRDTNGGLTYGYQWQRNTTGGGYTDIAGATTASYTVSEADLSGAGTSPTLRVLVIATDAFGFAATLTAESAFVNSESTGGINIVATGYEDGDNMNLSHTITDANAGDVAIELSSIEWQQRAGDSGSFVAIAGETSLAYTIDRADWASANSGADMLRAVAEYRDPFGDIATLTAALIEINRPTNGAVIIESVGGGIVVEGSTLRVNTSSIRDDNGAGTFSDYGWSAEGNNLGSNTELVLNSNNVESLADGDGITLALLFTDGLGFTRGYTVEYRQLAVEVSRNVNRDSVEAVVEDVNGITSGRYTYQWQQSETASGSYEDISRATSSSYSVPLGHDITKPYVRVEVSYILTAGSSNVAATVYSAGIQALGISTGNVAISGSGVIIGSTRTANIRGIEDLFGRAIPANYLSYEWQTSDTLDSNYIAIAIAGDTQSYRFAATDFTNNKKYVRLHVESAIAGDVYSSDSVGEDINRAATGALRIDGRDYRPGGVFIANTSAIRDTNGGVTYSYQWQRNTTGGSYTDIAGATTASYTVSEADFSGAGTSPTLRVLAIATDAFGFAATLTAESAFVNSASTGGINIVATGYEDGDNMNLSHTITDANAGNIAIELSSIEWQQRAGDSSSFVAIAGETGLAYTIDRADWASANSGADMLRAIAEYRDPFGDIATLTATVLEINRPTNGAVIIESVGGGIVVEGSTLRVNTSSIRDDNGAGTFSDYGWSAEGNNLGSNTELVLNINNVELLADGDGVTLTLLFTDGLGYTRGYTVEYRQLAVDLSLNVNRDSIDSIVDDVNGITSGRYTYQWQQSETASGSYEDIGRATGRSYSVPLGHDITKPYVRVEVSYILTAGSSNVAATVYSAGIQALGISTGNVAISGRGVIIGSTRTANIRGIEDLFGRAIPANYLSYEWQTSDTLDSNYIAIAIAGDTERYTLAAADFTNNKNHVRLHVESAIAGDGYSSDSTGEDINEPTSGILRIDGNNFAPGGVFSANTSAIRDTNGIGSYTYQWMRPDGSGDYEQISGETSAVYTVNVSDFVSVEPDLRLEAVHTDAFGFVSTLISGNTVSIQMDTSGNIVINTNGGYEHGDVLQIDRNINDNNGALTFVSAKWQSSGGGGTVTTTIETSETYTIDSAHWADSAGGADMLRVVAAYRDPFGDVTTLTATAIEINRPTNGNIRVVIVGGGTQVSLGSTLSVDIGSLSDENGEGSISYQWVGGGTPSRVVTTPLYIISQLDVSLALQGQLTMQATVTYIDGLGFVATISARLSLGSEEESRKEILDILGLAAAANASNVINKHLSQISNNTIAENNTYLEINDVAVDGIEDITESFAKRTSDTLNTGELFALDKFKAAYSGIDESGDAWSSWVEGSWSKLSGSPTVGDNPLRYEGDSFGIFAGADKEFGDNARAGVAVGINNTELDLDIDGDEILDDKIVSKLNSILPYLKWRNDEMNAHLLFLGGYGIGKLELQQQNDVCRSDMNWLMASIEGGYKVFMTEKWDIAISGKGNLNHSNLEGCNNLDNSIPGAETNSGEGSFGVQTGWLEPLADEGSIRPYLSIDTRISYGDAEDKAAYDLGGGFKLSLPLQGVSFNIDGKRQINNTEHNRDSISGGLLFGYGGYESSLKSSYGISDGIGAFVHRLELNHISEWGVNTINSGIYVQRSIGENTTTDKAGLHLEMEWK